MNAYSTLWLDQKLPSFTTLDAAFVPFEMNQPTGSAFFQRNWTAQTTMYSSSLDCWPALVGNNSHSVTYDSGKGCVAEDIDIDGAIPDSTSLFSSYDQTSCASGNSSKAFMAFSFQNSEPPHRKKLGAPSASYWEKTVLFCEPSYRTQSVNVTLTTPNVTISAVEPLGPPQQLSNTAFNISTFESIVVSRSSNQNGLDQSTTNQLKGDINETTQEIDTTQLEIRGITDVLDNIIVFAVGVSQLAPDSYLNASVLATSLDRAYSLLFALALNSVLSTSTSTSSLLPDVVEGTISGDKMLSQWSEHWL